MNGSEDHMEKTGTLTVRQEIKERLEAIARERGIAPDGVASEALEHYVADYDHWKSEIERRKAVPQSERRYVSRSEGRRWIELLGSDNPLPRPKGSPLT
jgi:predicted transcriptional regulator